MISSYTVLATPCDTAGKRNLCVVVPEEVVNSVFEFGSESPENNRDIGCCCLHSGSGSLRKYMGFLRLKHQTKQPEKQSPSVSGSSKPKKMTRSKCLPQESALVFPQCLHDPMLPAFSACCNTHRTVETAGSQTGELFFFLGPLTSYRHQTASESAGICPLQEGSTIRLLTLLPLLYMHTRYIQHEFLSSFQKGSNYIPLIFFAYLIKIINEKCIHLHEALNHLTEVQHVLKDFARFGPKAPFQKSTPIQSCTFILSPGFCRYLNLKDIKDNEMQNICPLRSPGSAVPQTLGKQMVQVCVEPSDKEGSLGKAGSSLVKKLDPCCSLQSVWAKHLWPRITREGAEM
ncbi:hypothetical protein Anapl_16326 [Anas platyrhynchos]|uniref:Uncharacterized protein n=1 Tax=Anas platyrhynchos TaxID=8839 RepID=R0KRT9_ANAPL|nr:hypothetical protein Anapl_16326 [Anas platyrhynchos]